MPGDVAGRGYGGDRRPARHAGGLSQLELPLHVVHGGRARGHAHSQCSGQAMKWGRCLFDFGWHAVDERRDYSDGVLEAECGHLLPMVALHDEPAGRPCEACASLQLARAQATTASANTDTATGVSGATSGSRHAHLSGEYHTESIKPSQLRKSVT